MNVQKLKPSEYPTIEEAQKRMLMYKSRFRGWSMYEVDGVFMKDRTQEDELFNRPVQFYDERTQVIRLIFQAESSIENEAKISGCYDVLEAIMRWTMAEHMRLDHVLPWSKNEKNRFFRLHGAWPKHKRSFVNKNYEPITKEFKRWIDDVGLFIFAFLVRNFAEGVREIGHKEDEIWVVNWFNVNLNVAYPRNR